MAPEVLETVSFRRLPETTRSTADAEFITRGELVTYFQFPHAASLRRVWGWERCQNTAPTQALMAHHEAGHVVMLEWLGLGSPRATASATKGLTYLHNDRVVPRLSADPTGKLAAVAAAAFHAGLMAELLHMGQRWCAPIYRNDDDQHRADILLREVFGLHASGAHAFSQRVALHVLSHRWSRVQEIAAVLICKGEWRAQ
ncbi:MAG: hypothetical protein BGO35_07955 [Burkholderiales bacterium 64-34]|nr:MAG: hypothetical protein BGO35_07955 [Burkholderiales bacterium 64-34]